MTLKAQILIGGFLILVLLYIVNMVRKRKMELKYVLSWMLADIILILFVFIPEFMNVLAQFLGIHSPVNMIFFLGFLFSLIIIFFQTIALSRISAKLRRITQALALETCEREKENREQMADESEQGKNQRG